MHIPSGVTCDLNLLSFDDALRQAERPNAAYDSRHWLYVPNAYMDYRYILGTRGRCPLICVGINPSTAAPNHLDNTLKSVERIALHNGFDSFLMFNVYAQRATRPADMEEVCNPALHLENMNAFRYVLSLSASTAPAIWAAWGTIIEARPYLIDCVRDMIDIGNSFGAHWFSSGARSKKGHPHHPLYLKKDSGLDPFDIQAYVETLAMLSHIKVRLIF